MMWGFFNWQGGSYENCWMAIPGGADDVWRTEMDGVIFILFFSFPSSSGYGGGVVDIIYIYI